MAWYLGARFYDHGGNEGHQVAMPPSRAPCLRGCFPLVLFAPQSTRTSYHLHTAPSRCTITSWVHTTFWLQNNLLLEQCSGGQLHTLASFISHRNRNPRHSWFAISWSQKFCHPFFLWLLGLGQNLLCPTRGQVCTPFSICCVAGTSRVTSGWIWSKRSQEWWFLDQRCPFPLQI